MRRERYEDGLGGRPRGGTGGNGREPAADRAFLLARQRVEEEILRATGNDREMSVFLDDAGTPVLTRLGEADSVIWMIGELLPFVGRVRLVTHNHPHSTPPSQDDLALAMFLGAPEVDAISQRQRYRLWTPTGVWPDPAELDAAVGAVSHSLLLRVWDERDAGRLTDSEVDLLFYRLLWERIGRQFPDRLRYAEEDRT